MGRTIHLPLLILVRVVSNKSKDICDYFVGLVPDDTVKKGTSKRHEMDKKLPILWCTFLRQFLGFLF